MSDDLKKTIGGRLLASRIQAALTQEQLAAMSGRSVEAVSNIERGLSLPTLDTIERIAKAVDVPIALFFDHMSNGLAEKPNADVAFKISLLVSQLNERDAALLMKLAQTMRETPHVR